MEIASIQRQEQIKGTQNLQQRQTMQQINQDKLYLCVDLDWGNDKSLQQLVTGLVYFPAGGNIAYKSKHQLMVALSSAETEFTAAAETTKTALLYLCSILLQELRYTTHTNHTEY